MTRREPHATVRRVPASSRVVLLGLLALTACPAGPESGKADPKKVDAKKVDAKKVDAKTTEAKQADAKGDTKAPDTKTPDAKVEPSVAGDPPGTRYQFERTGYFISDAVDSRPGRLVFNRTVGLRDSWAKVKDR